MDLSTLIGIIGGIVLIIVAITTKGPLSAFIEIASVIIVLGGSFAALMTSYPLDKLKDIIKIGQKVFKNSQYDYNNTIEQFAKLSYIAKKEGLLAMEKVLEDIDSEFMKKGIMLIVDGTDPEMIKNILELDIDNMVDRHSEGEGMYRALAKYTPAFGMVGTLIGLIIMLQNLADVSSVGPAMGVALITTFYGSFFANAIFMPIADKLKNKSEREAKHKEMIIQGIMSVQAGEAPLMIKEKLRTFMPEKSRNNEENLNE